MPPPRRRAWSRRRPTTAQPRLDEPVYLYRDGRQAAPPQVRIANADKTYDQAFATEYG
jgi:hypothetical protein